MEYHTTVARYFNKRKEKFSNSIKRERDQDDVAFEAFLSEQKASLEKVANVKRLEKMQPKDASLALADIMGTMATYNTESGHVNHIYKNAPELEMSDEKEYLDAEKVFMESCKKIFPEITVQDIGPTIEEVMEKIDGLGYGVYSGDLSDYKTLLKEDPKKLMEGINDFLYFAGNGLRTMALGKFKDFINDDIREENDSLETTEEKLAIAAEAVYKLQLVKRQLIKSIYGRENTTPSERKEIDAGRAKI